MLARRRSCTCGGRSVGCAWHGTVSLFAALVVQSAEAITDVKEHTTGAEFIKSREEINRHFPADRMVHGITDNLAVDKTRGEGWVCPSRPLPDAPHAPPPPAGSIRSTCSSQSSPDNSSKMRPSPRSRSSSTASWRTLPAATRDPSHPAGRTMSTQCVSNPPRSWDRVLKTAARGCC